MKNKLNRDEIKKWNKDEVIKWFQSIGCMSIYKKLKPSNGESLFELHQIQLNAPEFFYKLVLSNDINYMLVFSSNLKKLFNE